MLPFDYNLMDTVESSTTSVGVFGRLRHQPADAFPGPDADWPYQASIVPRNHKCQDVEMKTGKGW